jgi:hypothetical protein
MRTWGRIVNPDGSKSWVEVATDPTTGDNSWVYVTALCQVLLLNLGESPFYASSGIPAKPTVVQQTQPDYYVARVQSQFAQYFANLVVAKQSSNPPSYQINVTLLNGAKASLTVQIPQ